MDHVKRAIAREEGSAVAFNSHTNTTSRITILCEERDREKERKRASCPPHPTPAIVIPRYRFSAFFLPLTFPSPSSRFQIYLVLSVLQAKGRNRWFVSFLSFPSSLGLRFCHHVPRLLPRIICIELIPATVGFSSNQPLPFSLSPLPHMLECKFKSTRPK